MRNLLTFGLVAIALACPASYTSAQSHEHDSIQGVWRVTELWTCAPESPALPLALLLGTTEVDPQPSLCIFTRRHYSFMLARPDLSLAETQGDQRGPGPTDAEKVAAYDSFDAHSGTYDLVGTTLTLQPVIAKAPDPFGRRPISFSYRLDGDTLWLTFRENASRYSETRITLLRIE